MSERILFHELLDVDGLSADHLALSFHTDA